uniref:Uncharacterized protein n=1 Tax=Tanacetum cinerariifolium TaxID=118510 RepID=A0A699GXQ1_TANCI|nr:hypothetical protein [Tanacetum cinerariifolium]
MNKLEKQLNNEILHEKDSKSAISVIKVHFDKFIHSEMLKSSNYDSNAREARQDFKDHIQMGAQSFKEFIIQHMESTKQWLKQRMLAGEKDCSGIVSDKGNDQGLENQSNTSGDESRRSRNECNDKSTSKDDTDIRPSYDIEPMVEVPYNAEYNVFAVETQHSEQPESINDTHVMEKDDSYINPDSPNMCDNDNQADQNAEACDDERVALANLITELETYKTLNDHTVDYDKLDLVKEKHDELVKHSFLTKSHYEGLVKEKTKTQNDSFKFVHELKQEMHADLKYVESLEKEIDELKYDKAYFSNMYDILLNSPKHVSFQSPRESIGSNVMVHNYYLKEAKKKAQLHNDKALNTKPNVQQSARLPNTTNGNKLKPRNLYQQPRNWPPSMSSHVSNRTVNIAEPPRNQKPFLKSKDLACPTCKKCIYNANRDRSGLTWKPTGKIFTQVGLKWIPIRKSVETCYNTNDSASPLGKETHNPKTVLCANSSSLSAGTSMASEPISSKGFI